ncbi:hypothetical protein AAF712_003289 [Marasmius tenuissimus]|uniref:Uncharacterized protein n=1 Tax=Marasmius tenuissimus TaxID=585030 RepID=A0ABR3A8I1_9AGAR
MSTSSKDTQTIKVLCFSDPPAFGLRPKLRSTLVDSTQTFSTFLKDGFDIAKKSGTPQSANASKTSKENFYLFDYTDNAPLLEHLRLHAPWLLSNPAVSVPVLGRKEDEISTRLLKSVFERGYYAFQIIRSTSTDFHKDDIGLNNLVDVTADTPKTLIAESIENSKAIEINELQVRRAESGARRPLFVEPYWDNLKRTSPKYIKIVKKENCDDHLDDDKRGEYIIRSLTSGTERILLRGREFAYDDPDTSSAIRGAPVQALVCDIFRKPNFVVKENQNAHLTYVVHYKGTTSGAHFTPKPDSAVFLLPRPVDGEINATYKYLAHVSVFLENISNPSKTDRTRVLVVAGAFNTHCRSKGLKCSKTNETLTVAIYLDDHMMATVYYLTSKDDASSNESIGVYVKKHDFYLAGKEDEDITGSQVAPFVKALFVDLYKDKGDLLEEIAREARSLSLLLQNVSDIPSVSKVATNGMKLAGELPGARVPDSESKPSHGSVPRGKSRKVSSNPQIPPMSNMPTRSNPSRGKSQQGSSKRNSTLEEGVGIDEGSEEDDDKDDSDSDWNPGMA